MIRVYRFTSDEEVVFPGLIAAVRSLSKADREVLFQQVTGVQFLARASGLPRNKGFTWTPRDIANACGRSKPGVFKRSIREQWPYIERPLRGDRQRLYALKDLPADLQFASRQPH